MKTNRERANILLEKFLNEDGLSSQMLLEFLINDYMDGSDAYSAMLGAEKEFFGEDIFDDDDDIKRFKNEN